MAETLIDKGSIDAEAANSYTAGLYEEKGRTIHERMVAILSELPPIGKNQKNTQQNFMFRGHDDVLNALNPLLAQHGVFVVPDVVDRIVSQRTTAKGSIMFEVNLHVRYTFYGAGGDSVSASAWGEGTDMGDKSTNKAMTMAFKNVLNQAFAISNEEMRDADADTPEHSRSRSYQEDERRDPKVPVPRSYAELEDLWAKQNLDTGWFEEAVRVYEAQHGSKAGSFQMLASVYVELVETGPSGAVDWFEADQIRAVFASRLEGVVLEGPQPAVPGEDPSIDMEGPSQ